jgi:lysyl-tRNA synthetase class 1
MNDITAMMGSKAWPYVEARKIVARNIVGRPVVFECGFGPSGLPHIGTFAEVYRTTLVRRAYEALTGNPTRLIVFSDDLDALRSVPDNVPNAEMLAEHIGIALSRVPDPFGQYESFAHYNNAMLRDFLDRFGFDYEFMSASKMYNSGAFNDTLDLFAHNYDDVRNIILPTLGPDRRATYSPFMPIDPENGRVHDTGVDDVCEGQMTVYGDYGLAECLYTDGGAKLQWKADWAMRWIALGVDYEMAGKDLIDSVKLSSAIVRKLGKEPPVTMIYEMFLDAEGKKIAKSKGNGLTIDTWLKYGSRNGLMYYLFQSPNKAHTLHSGIIPRAEDDYIDAAWRMASQTTEQALGNAVSHIHHRRALPPIPPVSYALLLNLAITAAPHDASELWPYVEKYLPGSSPQGYPELYALVTNVVQYYRDIRSSDAVRREPEPYEVDALNALLDRYNNLDEDASEDDIQFQVYEVGKEQYGKENLRDFFAMLYETLLGQSSGPRFGVFTKMLGLDATRILIADAASRRWS